MALDVSKLSDGVEKALQTPIFTSPAASGNAIDRKIKEWAEAYDDYCEVAMAGPTLPLFTSVERGNFERILRPAFKAPSPTAAVFCLALANAVETYWLAPPVNFLPLPPAPQTGVVITFPGKPALISELNVALNAPQPASVAARVISSALDRATRQVIVLVTTPPPLPPNPISYPLT